MTKERLRHYNALKQEQQQLRQQLETIEAALYSPKIPQLSGMPFTPAAGNPMEDKAIKHMELCDRYRAKLDELAAEQLAIEEAINSLDPTARQLLRYRYIECLTWEEVCVRMKYSWRQTHRLHGRAIAELRAQESEAAGAL